MNKSCRAALYRGAPWQSFSLRQNTGSSSLYLAVFLSVLALGRGWAMDAPHTSSCLDCHKNHTVFGNQIGTTIGNANVCQSCHQPGGVAHAHALAESDQAVLGSGFSSEIHSQGTSHRWDSGPAGRVVSLGGAPADALLTGGTYTGRYARTYTVTITAEGDASSAQFSWSASGPGGGSGTNLLAGAGVPLENGLMLTFVNYRSDAPVFRLGDSWQVSVRAGLTQPANPDLLSHMPGGAVVCSTCHNQHSQANEPFDPAAPPYTTGDQSAGRHFLRATNDTDQMCAECHGARFVTSSAAGSHSVGGLVASNTAYHPPTSLPLDKHGNRMWCSTCHQVHQSPGQDGNLLRKANATELCLECHTAQDTNTPASHLNPVSGPLWPGSQYGSLRPAETDPARRGACATCHSVHGWPDPSSATNAFATLLVEREENLCYACHDGSPATKNLRANFTKTYTHPVALSGRHTTTEDGIASRFGTANRHAECVDCHNVHQLTPDPVPALAPYASTALKGVGRVSVNNVSASQVVYTYRPPADPAPAKEYELCFECHSSWTTQPAGQTNYAAVFNDKNPSFHPVEASARDTGINPGAFVNGWGPGMLVTCSDCHSSDDPTIRGPHGSTNQWILKLPYTRNTTPALASNGLCFACHNPNVYNTSGSSLSRWKGVSDRPGHTHGGYNCYTCHESHGSTAKPFLLGHNVSVYTRTATGGTCDPSCHGSQSYSVSYPR